MKTLIKTVLLALTLSITTSVFAGNYTSRNDAYTQYNGSSLQYQNSNGGTSVDSYSNNLGSSNLGTYDQY
jgi:hypothetical protein